MLAPDRIICCTNPLQWIYRPPALSPAAVQCSVTLCYAIWWIQQYDILQIGNIRGQQHSLFYSREYISSVKGPGINQPECGWESGSIVLHIADWETRQLEAQIHFYFCVLGHIMAILTTCHSMHSHGFFFSLLIIYVRVYIFFSSWSFTCFCVTAFSKMCIFTIPPTLLKMLTERDNLAVINSHIYCTCCQSF